MRCPALLLGTAAELEKGYTTKRGRGGEGGLHELREEGHGGRGTSTRVGVTVYICCECLFGINKPPRRVARRRVRR